MKKLKIILFWFASFTWGLPMTLIGSLISLCLLIAGYKPQKYHGFIFFEVGIGWGGFNCGCFFFANKHVYESTKKHECGHGIQNIILGWFMPFVISIPSAIRYWYREYLIRIKKVSYWDLKPYDSIWFEKWATNLGNKYMK